MPPTDDEYLATARHAMMALEAQLYRSAPAVRFPARNSLGGCAARSHPLARNRTLPPT